MLPKLQVLLLSMLFVACGPATTADQPKEEKVVEEELEIVPPGTQWEEFSEDRLLAYKVENASSLPEKERNEIVDYAIANQLALTGTTTGLFYQIIRPGEINDPILWGDLLKAHYQGQFLDGKVFDDTQKRGAPMQFYVGNTIQGWNEGLQNIGPGGKVRLIVPSHMAYGEEGLVSKAGKTLVPPNTILRFDIEVLERLARTEYD